MSPPQPCGAGRGWLHRPQPHRTPCWSRTTVLHRSLGLCCLLPPQCRRPHNAGGKRAHFLTSKLGFLLAARAKSFTCCDKCSTPPPLHRRLSDSCLVMVIHVGFWSVSWQHQALESLYLSACHSKLMLLRSHGFKEQISCSAFH